MKIKKSIFEILNLRFEFEEIVRCFSLPSRESNIDNIDWFLKNGHKSNSLRSDYGRAREIATIIKEYANGSCKEIGSRERLVPPRS